MNSAVKKSIIFCIIGLYLVTSSIISLQASDEYQRSSFQAVNPTSAPNSGKSGIDLPFSDFKKNYGKRYSTTKE